MAQDLRKVNDIESLMAYFSEKLGWAIDPDDYYDIDDITYDFEASDLGLKEEAFAKITSLKQLRPLVDNQRWGIFFVNFESNRFEVSALRKILSGLIPARRNSDHAVWDKKDLLFLCTWGERNKVTIGAAHFEDSEKGLPQIKMISCEPAVEDFTQINIFEQRLSKLAWYYFTEMSGKRIPVISFCHPQVTNLEGCRGHERLFAPLYRDMLHIRELFLKL